MVYPLEGIYKDMDGDLSRPQDAGNYVLTVGTGGYASVVMNGIVQAVTGTAGKVGFISAAVCAFGNRRGEEVP